MKKLDKKQKSLLFLGLATFLVVVIGVSYSFFVARLNEVNKSQTQLSTKELGLVYTGVSEINCQSMIPGDKCIKKFSVENTSTDTVSYNIYMQEITNEFGNELVYTLKQDGEPFLNETVLPSTNPNKSYLAMDIPINGGTIQEYTLIIEYKYLPDDQEMGVEFKARAGIDAVASQYAYDGAVSYNGQSLNGGSLVFFSERKNVSINNGNIVFSNLKQGTHHVYFLESNNVSSLSDDYVKNNAKCVGEFNTGEVYRTKRIILNCGNYSGPTSATSSTGSTSATGAAPTTGSTSATGATPTTSASSATGATPTTSASSATGSSNIPYIYGGQMIIDFSTINQSI